MDSITDISAMKEAVKEAYIGINAGDGGPFGCVIVKDNKIIGRGHNRVIKNQDPTCHGEMEAIRDACKNIKSFDLSGAVLYTTAEPCPMCLGAILWSNIRHVYQGCNVKDTDSIGFRDDIFFNYIHSKDKSCILKTTELYRDGCLKLFKDYSESTNKKNY